MTVASIALAIGFAAILAMLIWLKKTDHAVGCTRFRDIYCGNPGLGKCPFPDCARSKNYKPAKFFVW
jgi:hypothetical protein